jgi:hypothetical protein
MARKFDLQQQRALATINAIMALIVILLVIQIWLLSATLDAYLAGHTETALSGAIVSGVLCAACFGMYRFVGRIDSESLRSRISRDI